MDKARKKTRWARLQVLWFCYMLMYALIAGTNLVYWVLGNFAPIEVFDRVAWPLEWWNGGVVWGSVTVFPAMLVVCAVLPKRMQTAVIFRLSRIWALWGLLPFVPTWWALFFGGSALAVYKAETALTFVAVLLASWQSARGTFESMPRKALVIDAVLLAFLFFFGLTALPGEGPAGLWSVLSSPASFLIYGINVLIADRRLSSSHTS